MSRSPDVAADVDRLWAEIDKRAVHQTAGMENVIRRLLRAALVAAEKRGRAAALADPPKPKRGKPQ